MSKAGASKYDPRGKRRVVRQATKLATLFTVGVAFVSGALAQQKAGGDYTKAQAAMGKDVFDKKCMICHGDHLQGGVGPALAGDQFLSVSQFQKISAEYFYTFMSTHMPLNNPGSLTKTEYLNLMAYLLQVNGYPAGPQALTSKKEQLEAIKIEPQH